MPMKLLTLINGIHVVVKFLAITSYGLLRLFEVSSFTKTLSYNFSIQGLTKIRKVYYYGKLFLS